MHSGQRRSRRRKPGGPRPGQRAGVANTSPNGVGLKNLQRRLDEPYPRKNQLTASSVPGGGFRVSPQIPFRNCLIQLLEAQPRPGEHLRGITVKTNDLPEDQHVPGLSVGDTGPGGPGLRLIGPGPGPGGPGPRPVGPPPVRWNTRSGQKALCVRQQARCRIGGLLPEAAIRRLGTC
jgi:hypothetical protein